MGKSKGRFRTQDLRDAMYQMRRLTPYMLRYRSRMALYLFCTLLYWGGNAGRLMAITPIIDAFQAMMTKGGENPEAAGAAGQMLADHGFGFVALIVMLSGLAMSLGTWGKQYQMIWLMHRATVDVQRELAVHLMKQPVAYFNTTRKGELMSRVTNDLVGVRQTYHIVFNDLLHHPIGIATLAAGAIYTSPKLSLVTLVLPLVLLPVIFFTGKIKRLAGRSFQKAAELTNFFHQYFEGIRVVKAFRMEDAQAKELDRTALDYFHQSVKVGKYQGLSKALVEVVIMGLLAGGLLMGGMLIDEGVLKTGEAGVTLGELIQFLGFLMLLYDPLRKLSHTLNNMSSALAANERVFELLDREPELQDQTGAKAIKDFRESVRFEKVGFEYLPGRPVLHDIDLVATKGTMTALVGATGSGKSTLLDLIPRFYLPTAGRILIDGIDIATLQAGSWLKQIAVVEQETFLFNTSVRENLIAANKEATEEELWQALEAANVADEIRSLPKGIDTELGDRGVSLSGGQRQRLAIARAFVTRAPVLLLDEATSALDTETERKVQDALDRLIKGATVFAIAHRLSTIRHANQILVLDQGRIIERGTHEELLARNGRYSLLYKTQSDPVSGRFMVASTDQGEAE